MVVLELQFDERDPLFKCCCGIFHVKTGTRILSIANVFIAPLTIVQLFFIPYCLVFNIVASSFVAATVLSSIAMFIATCTFWPRMVVGYLVTQLIILIYSAISFTVCMVAIIFPESVGRFFFENMYQDGFLDEALNGATDEEVVRDIILFCFYFSISFFASFMWEVFLLRVSFQCYNYLLEVRDAREGVTRLPPLRLESSKRGVFLVGLEHVSTSFATFQ